MIHFNFKRSIHFWQDIYKNSLAGFWLFLGSRKALKRVRPSIRQLLFWGTIAGCFNFLFSWLVYGGQDNIGYFNPQGLIGYALWPFLALLIGIFLAQKYNNSSILLVPALLWLILDSFIISIQTLLQYLVQTDILPTFFDPILKPLFTLLFVWQSLSVIWVFSRELNWQWWEKIIVLLATFCTLIVWQISTRNEPIWKVDSVEATINEHVFYAQQQLLSNELANIKPNPNTEEPQWYFLGIAGAAYQDVFKSEILKIRQQLESLFNTKNHSITLINNPTTGTIFPFASKHNIAATINDFAQKMNPERDILFLYMTSHGLENQFQLEHQPLELEDIDPLWLKQTLDQAGIRWRVIVISACRSGSFISNLQSDNTLIITASAADKDSFGCTHEADYTYFGRAFFEYGLAQKTTFKDAFILAQNKVSQWETAQGLPASEPQWSLGQNVALQLAHFEKVLQRSNENHTN